MKTKMNKQSILERIKEAKKFTTDTELAEFLGIKRSTLSNWSARNSIDYDLVFSKCEKMDYNWLLTGIGRSPNESIIENINSSVISEPILKYAESNFSDNIISIPIVDVSAAAGHGFFNADHPETLGELNWPLSMVRKKWGNYYCGRVNGESMAPTLLNQDYIIFRLLKFDEWRDLKSGDIYFIVDTAGTSCVKRVTNKFNEHGSILCSSDSIDKASFRDFSIPADEISHIYHVEWCFSNQLENINELYYTRLDTLEKRINSIEKYQKKK